MSLYFHIFGVFLISDMSPSCLSNLTGANYLAFLVVLITSNLIPLSSTSKHTPFLAKLQSFSYLSTLLFCS